MGSQNQFEEFFKRADLDHDGRISGAEAVSFFQGSGLSKQVLAQIWMHADQNHAGFLGRQEFYNALKLVTVAQSKRDLTPELVKAALYGPASAKIPPPQINLPPSPTPQPPSMPSSQPIQMGTMGPTGSQGLGYRGPIPPNQNMNLSPSLTQQSPPTHMGAMGPAGSPNLGYRGPLPPNQNMNQHYYPSQANQMVRPSQGAMQNVHGLPNSSPLSQGPIQSVPGLSNSGQPSQGPPTRPGLGGLNPGLPSSGMSNPGLSNPDNSSMGWLGGMTTGAPSGPMSQLQNRGTSPSTTLDTLMSSHQSKGALVSGNGFSSSSNGGGGGDPFAAFQMHKSGSSPEISSMSNYDNFSSSAIVPVSSSLTSASSIPTSSAIVPVPSAGTQPLSPSRSLDSLQSAVGKQPLVGQPQVQGYSQTPSQIPSSVNAPLSGQPQAGAGTASPDPSQPPWPKMTTPGIQKYTKVFMEVDTDRDGKITGDQARNLFLSWRLPREVLKQVWDLADQDSDSMLSLREFCIALYLMERFREGRPLPPSLPDNIKFDETLLRMAGVPHSSHVNAGWGPTQSAGFRPVQGMPGSQPMAPTAGLKPATQSPPETDMMNFHQLKPRTSVSENSQANANGDGGQNLLQASHPEAKEAEKKVEKVYLDSREKLEYYRSKMQELVLYKSRCDNRLNEIIERASADKREAELLGKKYEEKYKQVAEIASKLTIEEAKFREYQERKTELQQAITNMEQGGSADGILQVRADRIQSDFEELLKALSERCKKHGVEIKSAALIELPKGWQPGIQEGASVWDEEWDKFEDEGLLFDKDVTAGTQNANTSPKSTLFENGTYPHDDLFDPGSPSNADTKSEKRSSRGDHGIDSESGYTHSEEDSARSPHGSPAHRSSLESPSQDFSDVFARSSEADTDFHRSFDAQDWGNFDGNDDVDSVWGFEPKDEQVGRIFDSSGFGSSPRNDSPQGDNSYNKRSPFADSVPATPSFSKSSNSPRYSEAGDGFFDNYSRFDSFNMNESSRFSPPRETLTRFDSISSSQGGFGGHSRGFTSFDDADPFGSTGPFKVSSETPKKTSDNWSSF